VGMVLVNKKITNFDYQLVEGDMVEVFPVIGGG
jgi:molybdopterin converting factor small subunit